MKQQQTIAVTMRFSAEFLAALDAWRAEQEVQPSRTAAFRAGVERLISGHSAAKEAKEPSAAPKRRESVSPASDAELPPGKRKCVKCGNMVPQIGLHDCKPKGVSK